MEPIFDTHAHYDHKKFDGDRDELLRSLPSRGVDLVVNIGAEIRGCHASVALAEAYDHIYATVGIHPHDATTLDYDALEMLSGYLGHPKVVALGEIGLDFHYDYSPRDVQRDAFRRQIELARNHDMPVVIHSREADRECFDILDHYRPRGIVHCFSGSAEMASAYVKLGFYIGFTGVITFKNARKPLEAIAAVPLDRLLLETDCPYMAPEPHRGQRSDSTMIRETAKVMAGVKGVDADTLLRHCHENGRAVYNIT